MNTPFVELFNPFSASLSFSTLDHDLQFPPPVFPTIPSSSGFPVSTTQLINLFQLSLLVSTSFLQSFYHNLYLTFSIPISGFFFLFYFYSSVSFFFLLFLFSVSSFIFLSFSVSVFHAFLTINHLRLAALQVSYTLQSNSHRRRRPQLYKAVFSHLSSSVSIASILRS